jgi:hypothetical protein
MTVGYSNQIQTVFSVVYFKIHETKRQENQSHFLVWRNKLV